MTASITADDNCEENFSVCMVYEIFLVDKSGIFIGSAV